MLLLIIIGYDERLEVTSKVETRLRCVRSEQLSMMNECHGASHSMCMHTMECKYEVRWVIIKNAKDTKQRSNSLDIIVIPRRVDTCDTS